MSKKKIRILFLSLFSFLILVSCNSKNSIEKYYGRNYIASSGGVSIVKKTKLYSVMYFKLPEEVKFKDEKQPRLIGGYFDYPKVVNKGGKKYLTAKNLPEDRFEIVSDNTIVDRYTDYEFTYYENKADKEIENYYGNIYEGSEGGHVSIVKKTDDYSVMSFELPKGKKFDSKGNEPILYGGVYDNPEIVTFSNKKYIRADKLEERRLEIENDNIIVDTKTGYKFGLSTKSVSKK